LRVHVYLVRMMAPARASRRHAGGIAPDALAAVKTASVFESGPRVMAETRFDGPSSLVLKTVTSGLQNGSQPRMVPHIWRRLSAPGNFTSVIHLF
jgi:hypothetical protein